MIYHIAITISRAIRMARTGDLAVVRPDGLLLTEAEVIVLLGECMKKGYTWFSTCDHVDKTGLCAGHEKAL